MRLGCPLSFFVFASFVGVLVGCEGDDSSRGATASLSWDPGHEQPGVTYTVHYGKHSSEEFGSCNYEHAVDVSEPAVTIAGLDFSTRYYFAVSAYDNNNGIRSMCSDEVSKLTPEYELTIGDPPIKV